MRRYRRLLLLCLLPVVPAATTPIRSARAAHDVITIATWNMEWLVDAKTAHAARLACRSGQRAALPCDVARQLARDSADLARIASYAAELDADIVAFQEVESAAIARRIFHGYSICMADGAGVQHVGFAVRDGVAHVCGPMVTELSLNGRSRSAMSMRLTPVGSASIEMLVVHLKSGCSRDPLDAGPAACRMLAQQAQRLGDWIAQRAASGAPFIVLGDFNRVESLPEQDLFWRLLHADAFGMLAARLPFTNCYLGQPYSQFIDHVLFSNQLLKRLDPASAGRVGFRNADASRYRLSDHCPVRVSLKLAASP
ncbi:MAG: endonuclease/exonuclease/phosphatase family protein [Steroidobacteraceae bacterium]